MNGGLLSKMNRRAGRVSMKGEHLRDTQAKGSHWKAVCRWMHVCEARGRRGQAWTRLGLTHRRELANLREEKTEAGRRRPAGVCNEELDRSEAEWAETRPQRTEEQRECWGWRQAAEAAVTLQEQVGVRRNESKVNAGSKRGFWRMGVTGKKKRLTFLRRKLRKGRGGGGGLGERYKSSVRLEFKIT